MSAAADRLEAELAEIDASERLEARAARLAEEIAALRSDGDMDLATLRVTAAAMRTRFYESAGDDELDGRPWEPTEADRANAEALAPLLEVARPDVRTIDPSYLTPEPAAGIAVNPPTREELMDGVGRSAREVSRDN